jgi:hypothetical protein
MFIFSTTQNNQGGSRAESNDLYQINFLIEKYKHGSDLIVASSKRVINGALFMITDICS